MTISMRPLVLVSLAALCACEPFYRDLENSGRLAEDTQRTSGLIADAQKAKDAGDARRAASLYEQAISANPQLDVDVFCAAAEAEVAAGRPLEGRALLLFEANRGQVDADDPRARFDLASSYAAEGLTAKALDETGARTLHDALDGADELKPALDSLDDGVRAAEASSAKSSDEPEDDALEALGDLETWEASYGVPDQALLADAREQVAGAVWKAANPVAAAPPVSPATQPAATMPTSAPASQKMVAAPAPPPAALVALSHLLDRADAELAAGHTGRALILYALAYRVLPSGVFATHLAGFERAAQAAGDPAKADPLAYRDALAGDAALRAGRLGEAIHQYRLAVAEAPWWATAHANLAGLLDEEGEKDAANDEREWVARLPAGQEQVAPAPALHTTPPSDENLDDRPVWYRDGLATGLALGGVALGVTGTLVFAAGRSNAATAGSTTDLDVYDRARSRAALEQPLGLALLGTGIAALTTAIVLYHRRDALTSGGLFAAAPMRGGAYVAVAGGF